MHFAIHLPSSNTLLGDDLTCSEMYDSTHMQLSQKYFMCSAHPHSLLWASNILKHCQALQSIQIAEQEFHNIHTSLDRAKQVLNTSKAGGWKLIYSNHNNERRHQKGSTVPRHDTRRDNKQACCLLLAITAILY